MNNLILWIMGVIIFLILLTLFAFSVYYDHKKGSIVRVGIYILSILFLVLAISPFALHNCYPEQFKELMKESVDEEIFLKNINQKDGEKIISYEPIVIEKKTHSRAPAVFILLFVCALYTAALILLIGGVLKLVKILWREKSLEKAICIIENMKDCNTEELYKKKILDKYFSVWHDEQEE